jgi:CubicO group peptidase (beta-lactamase class C family)
MNLHFVDIVVSFVLCSLQEIIKVKEKRRMYIFTKPRVSYRCRTAILAVLLASVGFASAQSARLNDLDAYISKSVKDWKVPGLAIAIVKDGRVVFAKGYGIREFGKPESVDEHTLFAIGSTTKAMTVAALGMLVDEKKVQWDDPVTKHLPDFQLYDPYVTREVTVRDLLTHRAGLGNADLLWYGQDNSRKDILYRLRYLKPQTSMRSHFTYQNIMYVAAGEIVGAASGIPWEDFVQQRIFEPLSMKDTVPLLADTKGRPNVASPHYFIDGNVRVIENASVDAVAPAGSVWSSVYDMAKWMRFMLEEEKGSMLSASTHKELFRPQFIVDLQEFYPTTRLTQPHWTTYSLGWFQHDYNGRVVDFHTGSIDGMVAIIGLIRDEHLGVYVLANLDHAEVRHALMYRVFDLYAEKPMRDWSAEFQKLYTEIREKSESRRKKREDERIPDTQPSLPLGKYAGTYSDSLYGKVSVAYDGQLVLRFGKGFVGELEHWHYDTFRACWEAGWRGTDLVSFALNSEGHPGRLTLFGITFKRDVPDNEDPAQ